MSRRMQAVVMAGGEGSRLRPLTSNLPKPMLPVLNRPLMEHIIELLARQGFTDVVATVQFLGTVIRNYFGDGSDLGVTLSYATEEVPLGTAGSVRAAADFISGPFVVVSGDALTDLDVRDVVDWHSQRDASATIVLKRMDDPREFGIVITGRDGRIDRFLEKPTWGEVFSDTINTGIYVLEPEVLDLIPPEGPYDFAADLFPAMLDKGLDVYGYVADAYWTDIGTPEAFLQAHRHALEARVAIRPTGFEVRPGTWIGDDVDIHPSATLDGPLFIGNNVRVAEGASVGPYAVIGDNAIVAREARIAHSVVMDLARVGPYAQLHGTILGRGGSIERGATVEEATVLGDDVTVGAGAIVKPHVKVYPSRVVEPGAIVTESVVRERRATRSLFGARGVSGLVNLGITPVIAARIGMAFGTTLKRGSVVVTGRDSSRAARTMKRALIAGLNSAGVTCHDLELTPLPLVRFTVRTQQAAGGVSVRTSPGDPETVEIRLFDRDGADVGHADQRRIERIFFREDYRRASPAKLGELEFPARTLQRYGSGLLRAVGTERIRDAGLKVVVDYAFGGTSLVGPSVVGRLGCDILAVNAYVDEHRPVLDAADLGKLLAALAEHVTKSGADLGVLLEPGGEVAHLVDDLGRRVPDEIALLAFIQHEITLAEGAVGLSVAAPQACEAIATAGGASVRWTSTALPALMQRAGEAGVVFAGNAEGTFIWPRFMPAPDALMSFGKALELLADSKCKLSEVVDDLPTPHLARRNVPAPWRIKGAIMRRLVGRRWDGRVVLLDGVKVLADDGWALITPHVDEPAFGVWAEGPTATAAVAVADRYAAIVEQVAAEAAAE